MCVCHPGRWCPLDVPVEFDQQWYDLLDRLLNWVHTEWTRQYDLYGWVTHCTPVVQCGPMHVCDPGRWCPLHVPVEFHRIGYHLLDRLLGRLHGEWTGQYDLYGRIAHCTTVVRGEPMHGGGASQRYPRYVHPLPRIGCTGVSVHMRVRFHTGG